MANAPTVQSVIAQTANAEDLAPLMQNDAYTKAVNAELATRHVAAEKAQALAAQHEDLSGVVIAFAQVTSGLRAIAKRFPEVAIFTDEAIRQTQLAMRGVKDNPVVIEDTTKPVVEDGSGSGRWGTSRPDMNLEGESIFDTPPPPTE